MSSIIGGLIGIAIGLLLLRFVLIPLLDRWFYR